ncbi:MAG: SDR family NAD(P)-dependent oxidoreductase [Chitinophagaceae bacterium]|nr:SDR family NAD(P)-dependent oxidoreductase [Chitinophagaceae bacterium]
MKKVIIIGATSGIGKELALLYLKAGNKVGITGRRTELLEEIQKQFPSLVEIETFDVTGTNNISHLESLISKLGGMDLFVYNSGYGDASKNLSWEMDKATTLINVNGFVEMTNYAFNYFVKQGYGQIAATSSIAAYRGGSWAPAYNASKAFMSNYLEGITIKAYRLKAKIAITDIQPGFVQTAMAKGSGVFWSAPVERATQQIFNAIEKKKRKVQVTKRWMLMAWLFKWMPYSIYKRIG